MGTNEQRFLEKSRIDFSKIMYIKKGERRTEIYMEGGEKIETFHTVKGLLECLSPKEFECVNKGIVIAYKYVESVKDNSYIMQDGTVFAGRVRATKEQFARATKTEDKKDENSWSEFAVLDKLPLAFCIIELVFDEKGRGMDFIFRYCNKEMENLEGKSIAEMINKSFYEVFENGDKKWLVTYADVALNGVERVIESFSPEIDSNLRIYCYQPKPNFCACALIKV